MQLLLLFGDCPQLIESRYMNTGSLERLYNYPFDRNTTSFFLRVEWKCMNNRRL
ncbi:hypothetical protein HanXRQr2_Chr05g0201671 [Helianthus annuus]|uniref:Uncharacterized protein n=1 Tax=Helianthus annuus TaxID=4232 RepID=A0A9K3IX96_HELAN|nr:hypothetical protein HanXRQr2_Chr05g0201671 [Helianthus annuus]KAJ0921689.1 hypothetical protein HanPSC8_Chr05g0194531 [Helianthus annuus]